MKKIIVTGSCGFIGSHLIERLNHIKDYQIFATYNQKKPPNKKFDNIKFIKIDLNNSKKFIKLPKKIDYVIHLAANRDSLLKYSEGDKQIYQNFNITQNLANYCVRVNCKNFIFLSSVYIYSGLRLGIFKENFTSYPIEPLGLSKFISESILKKNSIDHGLKCISFRVFTVYGKNSSDKQFISSTIKKMRSKKTKIKFGNSQMQRDFIFIDDVVKAIELSLSKIGSFDNNFESINLGSGRSISINKAIKIIMNTLKISKSIVFDDKSKLRAGDTNHKGNFTKLKKLFNWSPEVKFEEGIKNVISKN